MKGYMSRIYRSAHTFHLRAMENWISALPNDLLVRILLLVPTKDAVNTMILSRRWLSVWRMLPELVFKDKSSESVGWFIDKSLQLHKAPVLKRLVVELGPNCPVDVDVKEWVDTAVNCCVEELHFNILWNAEPTRFPTRLYTCDTIADLTLSNKILVDVSSPVCLPSLLYLRLCYVVYKDEDSLSMLLSGCPVLKGLTALRRQDDNLKQFTVKVSSLRKLSYMTTRTKDENVVDAIGSLVIDSPALTNLDLIDVWGDYFLIESMPCLDVAFLNYVYNPNDMFLTSLSSVKDLYLSWTNSMVVCYKPIKFSRLVELYFRSNASQDCLEPLIFMLQNSPRLQTLIIDTEPGALSPSCNQPSTIPGCLSTHLEYFGWKGYGRREEEKPLVKYILANAKCLKTVEISFRATCNVEEKQKELESMLRISKSSQLLFSTREKLKFKGANSNYP